MRLTPCAFASRTAIAQSGCGIRLARLPPPPPRLKPAPPAHQIGRQLPTLMSPIAVLQDEDRHPSKSARRIQAALPEGHGQHPHWYRGWSRVRRGHGGWWGVRVRWQRQQGERLLHAPRPGLTGGPASLCLLMEQRRRRASYFCRTVARIAENCHGGIIGGPHPIVKVNVHSWDLKSLAFQAKTSVRHGGRRISVSVVRRAPMRLAWQIGRRGAVGPSSLLFSRAFSRLANLPASSR